MSESMHEGGEPAPSAVRNDSGPLMPVVDGTRAALRAPWAASVAGLLFAVLFTTGVLVLRHSPLTKADDAELRRLFAIGADLPVLVSSLYLLPFAGIMFLWFIAVIRDQVGEREDKFFATLFFGSGVLFITLLFAGSGVIGSTVVGVRELGMAAPTAGELAATRALGYTLLFVIATRAAAVCVVAIATLGLRSRTFPRWVAVTGYLLGLSLLLFVSLWDAALVLLPAWVAIVSVYILRRERRRSRAGSAPAS